MTKEELKETYSMQCIVERYGLHPNRAGFISCPFHKEKTASMKIYKDSYHCFGCGESGDIFSFIQDMDNLTFKEAFLSLGGTYDKHTFSSNLEIYKAKKRQEMRMKEESRLLLQKKTNNMMIGIYRHWVNRSEPLSDTWCDCYNALQYQLYIHEILNEPR